MDSFPDPTPPQIEDFLLRLYFGYGRTYLVGCIARAYTDLNRTLRGISASGVAQIVRGKASCVLEDAIRELPGHTARNVRLSDLSIVCSNCHRMLHRGNPVFAVSELLDRLRSNQAGG